MGEGEVKRGAVRVRGFVDGKGDKKAYPLASKEEDLYYADPDTYMMITEEGTWRLNRDGWLELERNEDVG